MMDNNISTEEWEKAKKHTETILEYYKELIGVPGVNTTIAITFVFEPLLRRYNSGERTQELYDEMMSVE
jgi:hypothetical protein